MARYIDAVELIKAIEENQRNTEHHKDGRGKQIHVSEHRHFIKMVYEQPTADVVPRSKYDELMQYYSNREDEVMRLKEENTNLLKRQLPSYYQACAEKEAINMGREKGIVEVVGYILSNHTPDIDGFFTMHESELEELKKKYTEESGNDEK